MSVCWLPSSVTPCLQLSRAGRTPPVLGLTDPQRTARAARLRDGPPSHPSAASARAGAVGPTGIGFSARYRQGAYCSCISKAGPGSQGTIPSKDCFINGTYYAHMAVRDYELDQFSVVNNSIYASYLQHARHKALASIGMSVESLQQAGVLMALSELVLRYRAPLRAQDVFVATASVSKVTGARLVLEQTVLRLPQSDEDSSDAGMVGGAPQLVLDGEATVVFLDTSYRPVRIPAAAKVVYQRMQADYTSREQ